MKKRKWIKAVKGASSATTVALTVTGLVFILLSLCVPWLLFKGIARNVSIGTFEISGNIYGLGFGTLDRTNAQITVWSDEYWSTAGSDFWFGWLSIVGGLLVFASTVGFIKVKRRLIPTLLVLAGGFLCILAFIGTTYYRPQTFVANGQINDYPIDIAILRATDATVNVAMGPWLSLAGGTLFIIGITLAYFSSKQREWKTCRE